MKEQGQALLEVLIILPLILWLFWISYDLVILFRDEYILDYALFYTLRDAVVSEQSSDILTKITTAGMVALGLKGTPDYFPGFSNITMRDGRMSLKGSIVRKNESGLWPPVSAALSLCQE